MDKCEMAVDEVNISMKMLTVALFFVTHILYFMLKIIKAFCFAYTQF